MFVTVKDVFLYSHHGTKNIIIAVLDSVVATIIIPCYVCVSASTECQDYEECDKLPEDLCNNPTYRKVVETSCRKFCKLCTGELKQDSLSTLCRKVS